MGANLQFINFKIIREKPNRYDCERIVKGPEDIARVFFSLGLHEYPEERMFVLALNSKNKIDGVIQVAQGGLNVAAVSPREIFSKALLVNANSIILAHNHPSGDPTPSEEDIRLTERMVEAGRLLGIKVLDHVILGVDDEYISLKKNGNL